MNLLGASEIVVVVAGEDSLFIGSLILNAVVAILVVAFVDLLVVSS